MKKIKTSVYGLLLAGMCLATSCGTTDTALVSSLVNAGAYALTGGTTTTASTSTKNVLINTGAQVLTSLLTTQAGGQAAQTGTAQQYTGTYTAQLLTYNASKKGYDAGKTVTSNATSTLYVSSNVVGITIPAGSSSNAQMTQVSLTNLAVNGGVYKLSDSSTVTEGKLTIGGQTYDLANAYVELSYSGTTSLKYTASLYFNLDQTTQQYKYAMNVTFTK